MQAGGDLYPLYVDVTVSLETSNNALFMLLFYLVASCNFIDEKFLEEKVKILASFSTSGSDSRVMKENYNGHDFYIGNRWITIILFRIDYSYHVSCHHCFKKLTEIICYTKYFCNFILGVHSNFASILCISVL